MGCELCGREIETTTHHLIPKNRKESPTVQLCQPCHKQVHATFTHHELKQEYNTIEALREADRLESFVRWIRKTDKTEIHVDESERVRRWRSYRDSRRSSSISSPGIEPRCRLPRGETSGWRR